jgi:hypothetical protein
MKFFAIRFFAVQSSYTLFQEENLVPSDYFFLPFQKQPEIKYYGKTYTTRILNLESEKKQRYLIGYILKSKDIHLIHLEQELFNESEVQNWEKLFFIIDREKQLFVCEQNSTVATPINVKNVLLNLTRSYAQDNGYEIKLDFLVDKFAFWEIIHEARGIYQIAFNLNAPNLFGGSKKANEWLSSLKNVYNMTEVGVDFRNNDAELKYDEEELESYRDYADSGGGSWSLGILQTNGRKKRFRSENHLRTKEIEFDASNPKKIKQTLNDILSWLVNIANDLAD